MIIDYASRTLSNAVWGLPVACVTVVQKAWYTGVGVGATLVSSILLGLNDDVNKETDSCLLHSNDLAIVPYRAICRVINPDYSGHSDGVGIFHRIFATRFLQLAVTTSYSRSFFSRHVISRLAYVAFGAAAIPTRIADFALGVIFGVIAVVPFLARIERLNTLALVHLNSTAVVQDVSMALRGFINPNQFVLKT